MVDFYWMENSNLKSTFSWDLLPILVNRFREKTDFCLRGSELTNFELSDGFCWDPMAKFHGTVLENLQIHPKTANRTTKLFYLRFLFSREKEKIRFTGWLEVPPLPYAKDDE